MPFADPKTEPWNAGTGRTQIHPKLPGIANKSVAHEKIRSAAYSRITQLNTDIIIYTDGSARNGTSLGGAAAVITSGNDPHSPEVIDTILQKGAPLTCSYSEEEDAMGLALDWLEENTPQSAQIITDSKSLCDALLNESMDVDHLRSRLFQYPYSLDIQWVPGHSGIAGNELADAAAKSATSLDGPGRPVSYKAICAQIRNVTRDPAPTRDLPKHVYADYNPKKEREITSRSDQSLLAKIRTGESLLFLAFKNKLDGITDPTCECGEAPHDQEHWMKYCPRTLRKRMDYFGPEYFNRQEALTKFPTEAVAFARETLRGAALTRPHRRGAER